MADTHRSRSNTHVPSTGRRDDQRDFLGPSGRGDDRDSRSSSSSSSSSSDSFDSRERCSRDRGAGREQHRHSRSRRHSHSRRSSSQSCSRRWGRSRDRRSDRQGSYSHDRSCRRSRLRDHSRGRSRSPRYHRDHEDHLCISTPDPECSSLDRGGGEEVTQVQGPLVRVTSVAVTPTTTASNSQYVVTLSWISPTVDIQNSTRGLRVQWQAAGTPRNTPTTTTTPTSTLSPGSTTTTSTPRGSTTTKIITTPPTISSTCHAGIFSSSSSSSSSPAVQDMPSASSTANNTTVTRHCQVLHFLHSPSYSNSSSAATKTTSTTVVSTTRWCYATDHPSRCQSITLSSLHSNVSLTVTVRMPPNLTIIEDPSAASEWKTPVSVVVDADQKSVLVLIQTAPPELNITSYQLTLVNVNDGITINSHILNKSENYFTFEKITVSDLLVVRVEPRGPGCNPRCQYSESANISLVGAPSTPTPTPAPPTQSTGSATTTTTTTASVPTPRPTSPTTTPTDMNLHKTTTATDPSVIVKPAVDQTEYNKSRNIILGTVFGVIFLAVIATVIFCIYGRTRSAHTVSFPMLPRRRRESNSSIIMEDTLKNQPIVLLLYSYDCPAHEVVVTTFAYYLKEVANCEVILDIWDQHNLQEQGVYAWLVDKVDVAQYIILVCSTGARFKCARNREFRMKHDRTLPDVFAWGVDHVAEKIRTATNVTEAKNRYISAYFDYAGKSDIPPKLEITKKFCLMKDVYSLYCHLHSIKVGQSHTGSKHGLTVDTYSKTVDGRPLQDALIDAKHFFKDNPNWLGQTLEPITPVLSPSRDVTTDNTQDDALQRPRRVESSSPFIGSENNPFLLERRKKRERDKEETMERIPHFNKKDDLSLNTPGTSPSHVPSDGTSSVTSMSPLMSPAITKPILVPTYTTSSGTLDMDDEMDADDTSQMQRDIDFIQNFDARHTWDIKNGSAGHFFVDVDMGVYTPPEDFISLASLEEETNRALINKSNPASPPQGSPHTSKTPSISSMQQQYEAVNRGSQQSINQSSPRKVAGNVKSMNSPLSGRQQQQQQSPATSSIGSPTTLNNNHFVSNHTPKCGHQSPVLTNSSSSLSQHSGSPHSPLVVNNNNTTVNPAYVLNNDLGASKTSISSPARNVTNNNSPVHGTPLPSSSPPQGSLVSSSHSSPFKGPLVTSQHPTPTRQPHSGSTNGHLVVELDPSVVEPTVTSNV